MSKTILFDSEARQGLQNGVDKLANAVKCTIGPKGNTVIYFRSGLYSPVATKDGVTVAREIDLKDPIENVGAQMVKEVANKTGEECGDGTSTSCLLAQAIITDGLKRVAQGANPIDLKRGIDKAVNVVVNDLRRQHINIDDEKILNIATISANNDAVIGKLISDGMMAVGKEGVIKVQDSKGLDNEMKVVEGMEFDRGFLSPYFVNNYAKKRAEHERPLFLIIDKQISVITDKWIPFLEQIIKIQQPLLIICDDMDGEALTSFAINNHKGKMKVCVVKVPGYTDSQKTDCMEDIAALTGATIIGDERGTHIEDITLEMLGNAESVAIGQNSTTIIGGFGDQEGITARMEGIKESMENCTDDREKRFMQSRLAKLSGKVAVLYIGAGSDVEMGEKKDRVDDALHATRAAVEEGIVAGGGVAYIRAIKALQGLKGVNKDENDGIQIIRKAIEEPMRHIVGNSVGSGKKTGLFSTFVNKFFESKADSIVAMVKKGEGGFGYNARTEVYEDLILSGVIDPAKVSRVALQNAASVANMILTTDCLLVEDKENK